MFLSRLLKKDKMRGINILDWKPERGEIIMQMDFKKCRIRTCAGLIWLRVVASGVPVPAQYVISCIQIEQHCT
jgi:hypothetical protein